MIQKLETYFSVILIKTIFHLPHWHENHHLDYILHQHQNKLDALKIQHWHKTLWWKKPTEHLKLTVAVLVKFANRLHHSTIKSEIISTKNSKVSWVPRFSILLNAVLYQCFLSEVAFRNIVNAILTILFLVLRTCSRVSKHVSSLILSCLSSINVFPQYP